MHHLSLTIASFLKNYYKHILFVVIIVGCVTLYAVQKQQIKSKEAKIKKQVEEIFYLEQEVEIKDREIGWLIESREIMLQSQERVVEIQHHYETKVIHNKKIVKEYYENPESKELLQKLYDLLNEQYSRMKMGN